MDLQEYLCDRLTNSLDGIVMELQEVNRNLYEIAGSLDAINNRMEWVKDK